MQEPGGAVQLAPNDPDRILPIQLFYDRLLDSGDKTLQLCSNGSTWIGSGAAELPCLTGCSEPGDTKRVCPAGFWGLRHRVSLTPEPQDVCRRPGLPPKVSLASGLRGVADYTTDQKVLKAAAEHGNTVKALLKVDRPAYSRDESQAELEAGPAQVIYFLCHVANHDTAPELVLGPIGGLGINSTTLTDLWAPNLCPGSPLVVLNACNSAAPSPERLLSLVAGFLERGAAGAIGTEITVFISLAMPFAEHFLQSYVSGVPLGEAIRRARVAMLAKGNPLGLAYLAFGLPELALLPDEPVRDTSEGIAGSLAPSLTGYPVPNWSSPARCAAAAIPSWTRHRSPSSRRSWCLARSCSGTSPERTSTRSLCRTGGCGPSKVRSRSHPIAVLSAPWPKAPARQARS